ncbi:hypothetical protein A8H31_10965 [Burkholderia thailandensis]|nr:hypothetical protein A8H31_10965 [Burkholderia thailandensis]NOK40423.1 hypothetical protein [Burkholderia thailandensis]NOK51889.1 hypothetical protein [Burkholderia thailandensis]PHH33507.1 hypothetical protein CRX59_22455 [Burkholderia thailandensis]PNE72588.1 hypothetical protein A8H38_11380 [Burkholderia thailandensis]
MWTSCASRDQRLDATAFSHRCHECVNRCPHAHRTRGTIPNAAISSHRRLGSHAPRIADRARRAPSLSTFFVGKLVEILGVPRSSR